MTDPAHFTDPKWAAQERARQARDIRAAAGLPRAYWEARGATLIRDGVDVAYIMRLRWAMNLREAKELCGQIAAALNALPTDGTSLPTKGGRP